MPKCKFLTKLFTKRPRPNPDFVSFHPYEPQTDFPTKNTDGTLQIVDPHQLLALDSAISFARRVCLTPNAVETTARIISLPRDSLAKGAPLSSYERNEDAERFVRDWFAHSMVYVRVQQPSTADASPEIRPGPRVDDEVDCFLPYELVEITGKARSIGGPSSPGYVAECLYMGFCMVHVYQQAIKHHWETLHLQSNVGVIAGEKAASTTSTLDEGRDRLFEKEVVGGCVERNEQVGQTDWSLNFASIQVPVRIQDHSAETPARYFWLGSPSFAKLFRAGPKELEDLLPLKDPRTSSKA